MKRVHTSFSRSKAFILRFAQRLYFIRPNDTKVCVRERKTTIYSSSCCSLLPFASSSRLKAPMNGSQVIHLPPETHVNEQDVLDLVTRFVHAMIGACIDLSTINTVVSSSASRLSQRQKKPRLMLDLSGSDACWTSAREKSESITPPPPPPPGIEWRQRLLALQAALRKCSNDRGGCSVTERCVRCKLQLR